MNDIRHSLSSNGANIWLNLSFTLDLGNSLKFRGGWKVQREGKSRSMAISTSGSGLNVWFRDSLFLSLAPTLQVRPIKTVKAFFYYIISTSANHQQNVSDGLLGNGRCKAVNGEKKQKPNPPKSSGSLPRFSYWRPSSSRVKLSSVWNQTHPRQLDLRSDLTSRDVESFQWV